MRKVFIDDLPTKKYGNTFRIDWTKSVGLKVRFIYDELDGEIEIIDHNNKKINILYNGCKYWIGTDQFARGEISYAIGIKKIKSSFKVGEIYSKKKQYWKSKNNKCR